MFDLKPDAPAEIRGRVPTDRFFARRRANLRTPAADRPADAPPRHSFARCRTAYNSHNPYAVLTGFTGGNDRENYFANRTTTPAWAPSAQYLGIGRPDVPGHVCAPAHPGWSQGLRRAGPYGGYLGSQYGSAGDRNARRSWSAEPSDFYHPVTARGVPVAPVFSPPPEVPSIGCAAGNRSWGKSTSNSPGSPVREPWA